MKSIKNVSYLFMVILLILSSSCGDDNIVTPPDEEENNCLKDDFLFTETEVNDLNNSNNVIITFDVKNNSSVDYNISGGSKPLYTKIIVKTTDGTEYETTGILTIQSLSAGSTTSANVMGTYGAGKTYDSYEISLYCQ